MMTRDIAEGLLRFHKAKIDSDAVPYLVRLRDKGSYAVSVLLPNDTLVHHLVEQLDEKQQYKINSASEVSAPFADVIQELLSATTKAPTFPILPVDELTDC